MKYKIDYGGLKNLRKILGYTQEDLGKKCHLSANKILNFEQGKGNITVNMLLQIITILDADLTDYVIKNNDSTKVEYFFLNKTPCMHKINQFDVRRLKVVEKLTREDLIFKSGISCPTIHNLDNRRNYIDIEAFFKIANKLGVKVDDLIIKVENKEALNG